MAITNNNVNNVRFLRNGSLFATREAANAGLTGFTRSSEAQDGTIVLARYGSDNDVKTLIGVIYYTSSGNSITIFDVESSGADVDAKIAEINAKLGNGVGSGTGESVTEQLAALSGDSATAQSGDTSVAGAKAYADDLISGLEYTGVTTGDAVVVTNVTETDGIVSASTANVGTLTLDGYSKGSDSGAVASTDTINEAIGKLENQVDAAAAASTAAIQNLDYSGVTTGTGVYVTNVTETDGVIAATTATLPTVSQIGTAGQAITAVSQTNGEIAATAGDVAAEHVTVADADGNLTATNVEAALAEIYSGYTAGDTAIVGGASDSANTLAKLETAINNATSDAKSYAISAVTGDELTNLGANVREAYKLVDEDGVKSGEYVKIYKDQTLSGASFSGQELTLTYILADGSTTAVSVDMHDLIEQTEFASGVTWDATESKVRGVVDPQSESFLTVGADGFKLTGVSGLVTNAIEDLDADLSGNSAHVTVGVVEENGVITAVNVAEDDIASAADLAELSGKTVTEVGSSNSSISATTAATSDGTVSVDLVTDASKVKMTGFTADASGFTAITTASTVTEAVKVIETEFLANEQTTSQALNDLEASKLENIVVNGVTGTVANKTATVTIDGADITLDGYTAGTTGNVESTDSVNEAISKLETQISGVTSGSSAALDNEISHRKAVDGIDGDAYSATTTANYISAATDLNDADQKLDAAIKEVSDVANAAVSGATMNGTGLTPSNGVLPFTAVASTSAGTATNDEAIVITTGNDGGLTFALDTLDCGTY